MLFHLWLDFDFTTPWLAMFSAIELPFLLPSLLELPGS